LYLDAALVVFIEETVSKLKKSRSLEVRKFSHCFNDILLSDTYAIDRTSELLDFQPSSILMQCY
jgi:hypothetical protein